MDTILRDSTDHIKKARIILLFISPHFIESKYCYEVEMKEALRRHESGEAIVIPIILRPCAWQDTPFGQLQALPQDGRAITLWENSDSATLDVAQGIMKVVRELSNQRESTRLNQVSGTKEEEIRENILDKLSHYHKKGRRVEVSQVVNWFKHKYERKQILQELINMQHDKIIQLDEKEIGRATEISFLKGKKKKLSDLTMDEMLDLVQDSSIDDWNVNFSQDAEIAVFKSDLALRIETKHTDEFIHDDDFYEKWANKFPDPHATSYYYHLYYGSTRLKDFILVSVDGGRALLPLPKYPTILSVEPLRYKIALIFDQFGTCDEYMKRAGLYLANHKMINSSEKEEELKRNLDLKRRIEKDFSDWLDYLPENRKINSKMILRAFDSDQYPESNEPDEFGEYSWFAAEIKSIYHNGLEFIFGAEELVVFDDNKWDFSKNVKDENLTKIAAYRVGRINFSDIVDYDLKGDEHYICPHFFCKFIHKGLPFEEVYFKSINEKPPYYFEFKDKKS